MTVSSELNRKQYAGNGVTTSFATSPVVFFDSSDLDVYVVTTATGAATLLTETTDYIVTGGAGSTGTVATTGLYGAPSASQTLVIVRNVPLTQAADFVQNDASDAEVVEDALDKLTMAVQQVDARVDRSFVLADSDVSGASLTVPTPVAGTLVGWNSAGTALENKVPADIDLAVVSPFIETLLDDTTAAAARTTLDVSQAISSLTTETAPAAGDLVGLYDASAGADRKMTLQNVLKVINDLTEDASLDTSADYVLTYDASASGAKKVLAARIGGGVLTAVTNTTSGTSVDITGIPSGAKRLTVTFEGVSQDNNSDLLVQIGDSGGVETSGYSTVNDYESGGGTVSSSAGWVVHLGASSAAVHSGKLVLDLMDAANNTWQGVGVSNVSGGQLRYTCGSKSLSATLDRVRITSVAGTANFDAGSIAVKYEG